MMQLSVGPRACPDRFLIERISFPEQPMPSAAVCMARRGWGTEEHFTPASRTHPYRRGMFGITFPVSVHVVRCGVEGMFVWRGNLSHCLHIIPRKRYSIKTVSDTVSSSLQPSDFKRGDYIIFTLFHVVIERPRFVYRNPPFPPILLASRHEDQDEEVPSPLRASDCSKAARSLAHQDTVSGR